MADQRADVADAIATPRSVARQIILVLAVLTESLWASLVRYPIREHVRL